MKNEMELEFSAISDNESFARVAVSGFLANLDPTLEEMSDVKTAISEAVTNVVIHAYPKNLYPVGKVKIHAKIEENTFTVTVSDTGIGIENIKKAREPLFTTKEDEERSGMGFSFMEAFMDTIEVESTLGMGTSVHMKKKIGKDVLVHSCLSV